MPLRGKWGKPQIPFSANCCGAVPLSVLPAIAYQDITQPPRGDVPYAIPKRRDFHYGAYGTGRLRHGQSPLSNFRRPHNRGFEAVRIGGAESLSPMICVLEFRPSGLPASFVHIRNMQRLLRVQVHKLYRRLFCPMCSDPFFHPDHIVPAAEFVTAFVKIADR